MKIKETNRRNVTRYLKSDGGWTLMELGIVAVIVVTISVVALNRITSPTKSLGSAVAQLVISDIAFAQELAVSTGKSTIITVASGEMSDDQSNQGNAYAYGRGRGRGHGYGYQKPHQCDDLCSGAGYSIKFLDESPVPYPLAAAVSTFRGAVTIETLIGGFRFDSGGRLVLPGYQWQSGQTSVTVMQLDHKVNINLARETGRVTITNG